MQSNNTDKNEQGINILDLAVYMASKWKWYVLSLLICCGIAYYQYYKAPLIYYRSASVFIKDPSIKSTTTGMDRFENLINKVNITNEILQFQSKNIMREVVTRLHTDVDYQIKTKFRFEELYTNSPVMVEFKNVLPERSISFDMTIKSQNMVELENIQGIETASSHVIVQLNDSLMSQEEILKFYASDRMNKSWIGKTIHVNKSPISAKVAYFRSNLGVNQGDRSASILTLALQDGNGTRAEDMLNTLITVYNEQTIKDKNQISVNSAKFINERLKIIEIELGGVEDELLNYKLHNNIINPLNASNEYIGKSSTYADLVVELETKLKIANYVKDYLTDPAKSKELIPSNSGIDDDYIESQISQYNNLKLKRDRLLVDSSEKNPVVTEINKAMHDLRQSVIRAVDNQIINIDVKRQDAMREQRNAIGHATDMSIKERGMLSISRQQSIKESLYMFLLNKREENELAQSMADNNARVIDPAEGGFMPISPVRNKIMGLGFLMGMAIPSVIFLFIMFMDTKVHSRKDIQGKTNIPFLGEIPYDEEYNKKKKFRRLTSEGKDDKDDEENGMTGESFKILRTNMTFMGKKNHKLQVITFTSFLEGAGKTFISSNLAKSLADSKKKVVMVDLDIRKRSLSHLFSGRKHIGITNYLADESIQLEDIIHHSALENLDIIYGGSSAPNPAELLMDSRLDEMMEELKKRYDYVIADNVPVGIVADATISNRISDLTIFVVRAGKLDRRQIPDLESLYKEEKLKNMSLVLNGVDPKYRGYGYRYGYGYGYGYGYRYGYTYGEERKKKKKKFFGLF